MCSGGKSFGNDLQDRVLAYVRRCCRIDAGTPVIVAVSGGADSLCLLHVLHRLSAELPLQLHVAHMNHMLRDSASVEDAAFVAEQARTLGLPCTVESRNILAHKLEHRCSLEEASREVRYEFLRQVAGEHGAAVVVTGHTRDDAVETVMLHLLRGSGVHGLRGLEPVTQFPSASPRPEAGDALRLVRPLLCVTRDETLAYCRLLDLGYREDVSNESVVFLRNRVRLEVLPSLRQINPRFDEALLRLAEAAIEDDDFITGAAHQAWERCVTSTQAAVRIDVQEFTNTPPAIQLRLVRRAMVHLSGSARDVAHSHMTAIRELAVGAVGKQSDLPHGITWRREESALVAFHRDADPAVEGIKAPAEPLPLHVPGETWLPGWRVIATSCVAPVHVSGESYVAYLDAGKTGTQLSVRRRRSGDRFRPLGMSGEKKLQDFMVDERIPLRLRDTVPVVCSGCDIVWLVGRRIDDRAKVTGATRDVIRLEFVPTGEQEGF